MMNGEFEITQCVSTLKKGRHTNYTKLNFVINLFLQLESGTSLWEKEGSMISPVGRLPCVFCMFKFISKLSVFRAYGAFSILSFDFPKNVE